MTNREFIAKKNNVDLLHLFGLYADEDFPACPPNHDCADTDCFLCWLRWLESEYNGGDNNAQ